MRLFSRRQFTTSLFCAGLMGGLWTRFVEPWWFKTTRRRIPVGFTDGRELTVLHLSDFHADPMPLDYLRKAIRAGLELQPDLILCTGDFITSRYDHWDAYADLLAEMPRVAPTYASLGNHDGGGWSRKGSGYPDTSLLREALAKAGVQLLYNEQRRIQVGDVSLSLVGLGDWWAGEMRPAQAFRNLPADKGVPTVLLSHNPDTKDELRDYSWDLMLSGHTHGGQLSLPFIGEPFAPIRDKRYVRDLHRLGDRWLYISSGVGCLHTARFNARPEISLLTLA
jgi:uncharacterized protein